MWRARGAWAMSDAAWGLQMTVLGMGLVFGLLCLLWGLLTLVQRFERGAPPAATAAASSPPASSEGDAEAVAAAEATPSVGEVEGLDDATVAAIVAAVLAHRALLRREAAPAMRRYQPGSLLYASRWLGAGRARQNHSWHGQGRGGR